MNSTNQIIVPESRGGSSGAPPAPPPLPPKIGKNMIFCVKSLFFTRNAPKIFAPPSARKKYQQQACFNNNSNQFKELINKIKLN